MSVRAIRPFVRAATGTLRAGIVAPRASLAIRPVVAPLRTFVSSSRRLASGETDSSLSSALASEYAYELEAANAQPKVPEFLQAFQDQGIWEIRDTPGSDDVVLVRKFGNETVKLTFQISDLEDPSAEPETDIEGNPLEEGSEEELTSPPYITCSLLITKSAFPGSMSVDLEAGEEGFQVTNVAMYEKALGEAEGAEGDWQRRSRYLGPQFEHLDSTVQDAFDSYLAERGVNEALANFVLQYAEHKEQKDYVSWLKEVQGFVDA